MLDDKRQEYFAQSARVIDTAKAGDEELGPLKDLPGTWQNSGAFDGRGWNMIALPFATRPEDFVDYRVLVNQFNETLKFSLVDKGVPNRGIEKGPDATEQTDQFIVTIDYEQMIKQKAAADEPTSGEAGCADLAIHHEPGLFLHMKNETTDGLNVARLGTIPHGNSILTLGTAEVIDGPPTIPEVNTLPIGVPQDLENNPYLAPYKHFNDSPFLGVETNPAFPGFNPVKPHELLNFLPEGIKRTTILRMDTEAQKAGIVNIPFIEREADAEEMEFTMWIMELEEKDDHGEPKMVLAYLQVVMLDFFPIPGDPDGKLIRWPHASINMMEKVAEPDGQKATMPSV